MSVVFSAPISSAGFQLCQLSVCGWVDVCVHVSLCRDTLYAVCCECIVVCECKRRESERQRSVWVSGYGLALLYGFRCSRGLQGCHAKLIKCSHLGSSQAATQCPQLNCSQHLKLTVV